MKKIPFFGGRIIDVDKKIKLNIPSLPKKYSVFSETYYGCRGEHLLTCDKIIIRKYGLPYLFFYQHYKIETLNYVQHQKTDYLIIVDDRKNTCIVNLTNKTIIDKDDK